MILRHATLIRNLPCIERLGLLCRKSRGKRAVVWLHTPAKSTQLRNSGSPRGLGAAQGQSST
jgi:hypothetical protein